MVRGTLKSVAILAALLFALLVNAAAGQVTAQASGSEAAFISSGQTATLDCAGGKAAIIGNGNKLTITGYCTDLALVGSNNTIKIEFAAAAKISFAGSNNAITWTSEDGKPPSISYVGTANIMIPPIP
ncbi:DUF3060 domain-containing protein [uncultured Methylovirgula sp.]|uniref:DUF3060 domain-containing protein n=1 Tax=uncultured Methylovirgula sp. TaxID=1285960 RepID=UPI002605E6BF|nr:DUF3060 domain-containing protein [uncultured Methylovirgula sp.]